MPAQSRFLVLIISRPFPSHRTLSRYGRAMNDADRRESRGWCHCDFGSIPPTHCRRRLHGWTRRPLLANPQWIASREDAVDLQPVPDTLVARGASATSNRPADVSIARSLARLSAAHSFKHVVPGPQQDAPSGTRHDQRYTRRNRVRVFCSGPNRTAFKPRSTW